MDFQTCIPVKTNNGDVQTNECKIDYFMIVGGGAGCGSSLQYGGRDKGKLPLNNREQPIVGQQRTGCIFS